MIQKHFNNPGKNILSQLFSSNILIIGNINNFPIINNKQHETLEGDLQVFCSSHSGSLVLQYQKCICYTVHIINDSEAHLAHQVLHLQRKSLFCLHC